MEDLSVSREGHQTASKDDEYKKLETVNFNLRTQLEILRKENGIVKRQFSQQKEELSNAKEEKLRLEKEEKESFKLYSDQKNEISSLQCRFVVACRRHKEAEKELKEIVEKFEIVKKENRHLKRRASLSSEEGKVKHDLEEEIRQKNSNLKEKNRKIERLQKDLKTEREQCQVQKSELVKVQKNLEETTTQLKKANETILEKEIEIKKSRILLTSKSGPDQSEKVKSLERQLTNSRINFANQETFIEKQNTYIKDLEGQVQIYSEAVEENRVLHKKINETTLVITRQEGQLKDAAEIMQEQSNFISQNEDAREKMKEAHKMEKIILEANTNKKQQEIQNMKGELEKTLKFVESIKLFFNFPGNDNESTANQLDELEMHIRRKLGIVNKFCELVNKTNVRASSSTPTVPASVITSSSEHPQSLPVTGERQSSIVIQPPPSLPSHCQNMTLETNENIVLPPQTQKASTSKKIKQNLKSVNPNSTKITKKKNPRGQTKTEKFKKRLPARRVNSMGTNHSCVCGIVFSSHFLLEAHLQQMSRQRNFQCQVCPNKFTLVSNLKRHMKQVHGIAGALDHIKASCRPCGLLFLSRQEYENHSCTNLHIRDEATALSPSSPIPSCSSSSSVTASRTSAPSSPLAMETEADDLIASGINLSDNSNPACSSRENDDERDDEATLQSRTSFGISQTFTVHHGVDSGACGNKCVCGIPFVTVEGLNNHIQVRSRKGK